MRPGGFEPPTNSLEGCCSIHLSYGRVLFDNNLTRGAIRRARLAARRRALLARRLDLVSILLRSEEHTSELQSRLHLVCRLLLEKKRIDDVSPHYVDSHDHHAGAAD